MARIDTTRLIQDATNLGGRALEVGQDPGFQKAWIQVGHDGARLAKSLTHAGAETRSAWRRSGNGGTGALARVLA